MRNVDTIAEELVYLLPYDTSRHVFIMNKYRIEHGMPPMEEVSTSDQD